MIKKDLFLFLAGGSIYPTLETAWRGHTHVSMALAGGVCLCLIDHICNAKMGRQSLIKRCCVGSAIITGVEFAVGLVVNLMMNLHVWDYSALPMNLMGQVCLPFSLIWVLLSLPAMGLGKLLDRSDFLCGKQPDTSVIPKWDALSAK